MAAVVTPTGVPTSVWFAISCIALSAVFEATITLMEFFGFLSSSSPTLIIGSIGAAILALLAFKIASHRTWAVRVFGFIAGAGVVVLANMILHGTLQAEPPLVRWVTVLQIILQTAALLSLFTRGSRKWLRPVSDAGA